MAAPMKYFCLVVGRTRPQINSLRFLPCSFSKRQNSTPQSAQNSSVPEQIENDWVGPPDKVSNIRPVKFHIPKDECEIERQYREQRQAVLHWHHQFWTEHNKSFFTDKEEYVKHRLAVKEAEGKLDASSSLTQEELSVFYKKFLDEKYRTHIQYNKEWYRKNLSLLWLALKVSIYRLLKKRTTYKAKG